MPKVNITEAFKPFLALESAKEGGDQNPLEDWNRGMGSVFITKDGVTTSLHKLRAGAPFKNVEDLKKFWKEHLMPKGISETGQEALLKHFLLTLHQGSLLNRGISAANFVKPASGLISIENEVDTKRRVDIVITDGGIDIKESAKFVNVCSQSESLGSVVIAEGSEAKPLAELQCSSHLDTTGVAKLEKGAKAPGLTWTLQEVTVTSDTPIGSKVFSEDIWQQGPDRCKGIGVEKAKTHVGDLYIDAATAKAAFEHAIATKNVTCALAVLDAMYPNAAKDKKQKTAKGETEAKIAEIAAGAFREGWEARVRAKCADNLGAKPRYTVQDLEQEIGALEKASELVKKKIKKSEQTEYAGKADRLSNMMRDTIKIKEEMRGLDAKSQRTLDHVAEIRSLRDTKAEVLAEHMKRLDKEDKDIRVFIGLVENAIGYGIGDDSKHEELQRILAAVGGAQRSLAETVKNNVADYEREMEVIQRDLDSIAGDQNKFGTAKTKLNDMMLSLKNFEEVMAGDDKVRIIGVYSRAFNTFDELLLKKLAVLDVSDEEQKRKRPSWRGDGGPRALALGEDVKAAGEAAGATAAAPSGAGADEPGAKGRSPGAGP